MRNGGLFTPKYVKRTILHIQICFLEYEPTRFETCSRQQKLNINLKISAFRWFVLNNYIKIYGAKKALQNIINLLYHTIQTQTQKRRK
jgi:hypothetical protein